MWSSLEKHMLWVAIFQGNLLVESSRGTLKMEVFCFFRKVSVPDYLVTVEGNNPIDFWIEMRS